MDPTLACHSSDFSEYIYKLLCTQIYKISISSGSWKNQPTTMKYSPLTWLGGVYAVFDSSEYSPWLTKEHSQTKTNKSNPVSELAVVLLELTDQSQPMCHAM